MARPWWRSADVEAGVAERRVDQSRNEGGAHRIRSVSRIEIRDQPALESAARCRSGVGGTADTRCERGGVSDHPPTPSGSKLPHSKVGPSRSVPVASKAMHAERLPEIQRALAEDGLDAWLFCDFRGSDPIGRHILGLGEGLATRRWFYCVPASGDAARPRVGGRAGGARRAARRGARLPDLAGAARRPARAARRRPPRRHAVLAQQRRALRRTRRRRHGRAGAPVRRRGVSSADLVQRFEAVWSAEQYASHARAARAVRAVVDAAFAEIGAPLRAPTVRSRGRHPALHLRPVRGARPDHASSADRRGRRAQRRSALPAARRRRRPIGAGDFVLIDLWAKEPDGVYADITWTGYVGTAVPDRHAAGVRDRAAGARRRRRRGPARRARAHAGARVRRRRRRCAAVIAARRLRRPLRAPHRPLDRHRGARQRRQHRRLRDARHAPAAARHLLLDRARDLPARRVRRAQRAQRVC